jgi:hypothetical protein
VLPATGVRVLNVPSHSSPQTTYTYLPPQKTWDLEKKEYKTLAECSERKESFAPLLESFKFKGKFYHAFSAQVKEKKGEVVAGWAWYVDCW